MAITLGNLAWELKQKIISCEDGKQLGTYGSRHPRDGTFGSYCKIGDRYGIAFSFPDPDFDLVAVFGSGDKKEADNLWWRITGQLKKELKEAE